MAVSNLFFTSTKMFFSISVSIQSNSMLLKSNIYNHKYTRGYVILVYTYTFCMSYFNPVTTTIIYLLQSYLHFLNHSSSYSTTQSQTIYYVIPVPFYFNIDANSASFSLGKKYKFSFEDQINIYIKKYTTAQ